MTDHTPQIRALNAGELDLAKGISELNHNFKPPYYWARCADNIKAGHVSVFMAAVNGTPSGYVIFNRDPKYSLYAKLNIPEIQDLNVAPDLRRHGIGRRLVEACISRARDESYAQVGISFGLTRDYGAAQRLYVKMGFVPDGNGVTYDRQPVPHGLMKPVDDDLCLMLLKEL